MNKLEDAKRRFGSPDVISGDWPRQRQTTDDLPGLKYLGDPSPCKGANNALELEAAFMSADAGDVKQLQARNLRLKLEVNALQKLLNEKDEEIDSLRDPKPFKWVYAAVLVALVFVGHAIGYM